MKALFLSGQNDLQTRDHEAAEREEEEQERSEQQQQQQEQQQHGPARGQVFRPVQVNRFKLNVQTNAVCVDVLVWATKDEYGELTRTDDPTNIGEVSVR